MQQKKPYHHLKNDPERGQQHLPPMTKQKNHQFVSMYVVTQLMQFALLSVAHWRD